jgi:hypothetical protein
MTDDWEPTHTIPRDGREVLVELWGGKLYQVVYHEPTQPQAPWSVPDCDIAYRENSITGWRRIPGAKP